MASAKEVVYSDPYACLPVANDKNAGNADQLHLAGRGIERLAKLEAFVSLDTLWLNDNKLDSLEGLEENFRIKSLYLHNNRFKRLNEDCLSHCTFLTQVTLNGNQLEDLNNVFDELRPCHHLLYLDLFDNPIAQEDNYRLRVIGELPSVEVLDRHAVTAEERAAAKALLAKLASLSSFSLTTKVVRPPKFTPEQLERRAATLASAQAKLRKAVGLTRLPLETMLLEFDKRNLGYLPTSIVLESMGTCSLLGLLSEEERDMVVERYSKPIELEAIAHGGTMRKRLFHYRGMCEDVVPADLRLMPDEEYKIQPCAEISPSALSLTQYVRAVKQRREQEEAERFRATMAAASASHVSTDSNIFAKVLQGSAPKCEQHGLSPFLAAELNKIIKAAQKAGESKTHANRSELERAIRKMINFGKTPMEGVQTGVEQVLNGQGSVPWADVFDSLGAAIKSTGAPMLLWRDCTSHEGRAIESRVSQEGLDCLDSLLRASPKDAALQASLGAKTMSTAITVSRLAALRKPLARLPTHLTPLESVAAANNRSDLIVIPNARVDEEAVARRAAVIEVRWISRLCLFFLSLSLSLSLCLCLSLPLPPSPFLTLPLSSLALPPNPPPPFQACDWSAHLIALGLKGEALSLAIERKNRSLVKADKEREDRRNQPQPSSSSLPSNAREKAKSHKPPRQSLLPDKSGYEKGWARSTGTVIL